MVASLSLSEEEWGSVRHRGENKLIYRGCALLIVSVITRQSSLPKHADMLNAGIILLPREDMQVN
jgi:hypothetical protein